MVIEKNNELHVIDISNTKTVQLFDKFEGLTGQDKKK